MTVAHQRWRQQRVFRELKKWIKSIFQVSLFLIKMCRAHARGPSSPVPASDGGQKRRPNNNLSRGPCRWWQFPGCSPGSESRRHRALPSQQGSLHGFPAGSRPCCITPHFPISFDPTVVPLRPCKARTCPQAPGLWWSPGLSSTARVGWGNGTRNEV